MAALLTGTCLFLWQDAQHRDEIAALQAEHEEALEDAEKDQDSSAQAPSQTPSAAPSQVASAYDTGYEYGLDKRKDPDYEMPVFKEGDDLEKHLDERLRVSKEIRQHCMDQGLRLYEDIAEWIDYSLGCGDALFGYAPGTSLDGTEEQDSTA